MTRNNIPQRKTNKSMNGKQLLAKALTGSHIEKTQKQKKEEELNRIINK